jgi:hypothetical protein
LGNIPSYYTNEETIGITNYIGKELTENEIKNNSVDNFTNSLVLNKLNNNILNNTQYKFSLFNRFNGSFYNTFFRGVKINIKKRKEYYLKNRERILRKNAEYQKVTYHRNRFNLFLN